MRQQDMQQFQVTHAAVCGHLKGKQRVCEQQTAPPSCQDKSEIIISYEQCPAMQRVAYSRTCQLLSLGGTRMQKISEEL